MQQHSLSTHPAIIGIPICVVNRHTDIALGNTAAMDRLADRLKHARKLRGYTQKTLAAKSGVTQPTISDIETGEIKEPGGETTLNLCEALEISPAWLLRGTSPMALDEKPLPADVVEAAHNFGKLAPSVRDRIAAMIRELAQPEKPAHVAPRQDDSPSIDSHRSYTDRRQRDVGRPGGKPQRRKVEK